MMELIARIRAVLRRTEDMQDKDEPRLLVAGGICVDERAHTVFVNEQEVQLTLTEYQLMCCSRISGAIIMKAKPARSMCISARCGKSWARTVR